VTDAAASPPPGDTAELDTSKLDEIIATRRAKIGSLRQAGIDPYPVRFRPTHTVAEVRAAHGDLAAGESSGEVVTVAGRVVASASDGPPAVPRAA
jgi:lysyl-tRNA synthetase, class II